MSYMFKAVAGNVLGFASRIGVNAALQFLRPLGFHPSQSKLSKALAQEDDASIEVPHLLTFVSSDDAKMAFEHLRRSERFMWLASDGEQPEPASGDTAVVKEYRFMLGLIKLYHSSELSVSTMSITEDYDRVTLKLVFTPDSELAAKIQKCEDVTELFKVTVKTKDREWLGIPPKKLLSRYRGSTTPTSWEANYTLLESCLAFLNQG